MKLRILYKGIILTVILGATSLILSEIIPFAGSIIIALTIGIVLNNAYKIPISFDSGINFMSKRMLEFSLLFLAFGISFSNIQAIGTNSFILLSLVIALTLLISLYVNKKFNKQEDGNYLIGFGTAICGSAAIAAVAPVLGSKKEDTAISMAVVNLMGTVLMVILPIVFNSMDLSAKLSGYLLGGSLHSVGNVAGAGYAMGEETAKVAITIKLARVAMLSPALILYSMMIRKNSVKNIWGHFKLPWYVVSFVGISLLVSLVEIPGHLIEYAETIGKWLLTIAMVSIGLKISFKALYQSGKQAIGFGLIVFLIQMLLLFITSLVI